MDSLEITRTLHQSGLLSKQAALKTLKTRQRLIKEAKERLVKEAIFGWGNKETAKATTEALKDVPKRGIAFMPTLRNMGPLLGLAGLVTLGTTAARAGARALSDFGTTGDLKDSHRAMFSEYPELQETPRQATKYFDIMAKYAPALATDPTVAGTWVKSMMQQHVVDPNSIARLMDAQRSWEAIRSLKSPLLKLHDELPASTHLVNQALVHGLAGGNE